MSGRTKDGGGLELRPPPEMIRQTHYWGHSSIPSLEGIDWRNPQLTWRPQSAG
jgi:hypothetical protein